MSNTKSIKNYIEANAISTQMRDAEPTAGTVEPARAMNDPWKVVGEAKEIIHMLLSTPHTDHRYKRCEGCYVEELASRFLEGETGLLVPWSGYCQPPAEK